jgi:hypothetical protein
VPSTLTRGQAAALAGLLLSGAVEVWLARRTALPGGILERRSVLLAEIGGWWLAACCALVCVRALPRRTAVLVVLGLAVAIRIAALSEKAPLSDDLYRYAWDGIVQDAGTSPYRYPPDADELRHLRVDWLFPPAWAEREERESRINRESVRTIYPPVAEAWFWLEHRVLPLALQDLGYELAGLGLDLAVLAVLLALLRAQGSDPRWIALYALAPLPALESVQNAHVDTLAVLLALGAVALHRRRPGAAGAVLALAALTKIYPGLLLPLLLRRPAGRLRLLAAFTATCALAYLPHVLAVGVDVLGYLPGYLQEERYGEGERYLLVGLTGLSGTPATVVVALLLLAGVAWLLRRDLPLPLAGTLLLTGVFLLATPVQPWYSLLLLALAVLCRAWWALAVAAAAYPLLFATILDGPATTAGRLAYGAAALVVLGAAARSRRAPSPPAAATAGPP